MLSALLVLSAIIGAEDAHIPAYKELGQAVLRNRQQVRTLHVRTFARRLLKGSAVRSELYLDVEAKRWRRNTTGMLDENAASTPGWSEIVTVNNDRVYDFAPLISESVARIRSLATEADAERLSPFPDPRNAGLVPAYNGNSGTPFAVTGSRLSLYSYYVDCPDADETSVETGVWKGKPSRQVKAICLVGSERRVVSYVVVPGWGHSVVSVTVETYRENEPAPLFKFLAESEVALHEESQIWFPTTVHYQAIIGGKKDQDEVTEFEVISLNRTLPEELFTFKGMGLNRGHRVMDLTDASSAKKVWDGGRVVPARTADK